MSLSGKSKIPEILKNYQVQLLEDWLQQQITDGTRQGLLKETELREECTEFLELFKNAVQQADLSNTQAPEWKGVRDMLASVSRTRSQKGFTPSETATFVFSLKQPLFTRLRSELAQDAVTLIEEIVLASNLLDELGLWTTEIYQKTREEVIMRQQEELMELSTPVVKTMGRHFSPADYWHPG